MARFPGLTRALAALVALVALAVLSPPAAAGFGDLLKKGKAAVTPKSKNAAATETGPIQSRIQPPMTPENLAKFRAGMELEVSEREKVAKFLKTVKPREAYEKCKTDWAMSSEGQSFTQNFMAGLEGKSDEDMQKHMQNMGVEMEKLLSAKCGPDPGKYNEHWAGQQAREALGKAADQFVKGDDYAYQQWKEWVLAFCEYIEKLKKEADAAQKLAKIKDEGLRVPAQGGMFFVYTASEAKELLENCDVLLPLVRATI